MAQRIAAHLSQSDPSKPVGTLAPLALTENAERLRDLFGLSPFEIELLILLAGCEIDYGIRSALQPAAPETAPTRISLNLAVKLLAGGRSDALSPTRPLRRWMLVEIEPGASLLSAPLKIDERILFYLTGVSSLDVRLDAFVSSPPNSGPLPASQFALVEALQGVLQQEAEHPSITALQLAGGNAQTRMSIAAQFAASISQEPYVLSTYSLPKPGAEIVQFARLWQREAALENRLLIIEFDEYEDELSALSAVSTLIQQIGLAVVVVSPKKLPLPGNVHSFMVKAPTLAEQQAVWNQYLGDAHPSVRTLPYYFSMENRLIQSICEGLGPDASQASHERLWTACRRRAASQLSSGVTVLSPSPKWEQLVLSRENSAQLKAIIERIKSRPILYEDWGFNSDEGQKIGVSALFYGDSGTGKSFAAEILAGELALDLYRVDLSAVVDKYIGETEKKLSQIFDAAEISGAVLLFDEADSLFGKRTEVKDSHDRYANVGVSYLLQRLENYRGLAILTSNLKDNIDAAFLRRFEFMVHFMRPESTQRHALWQKAFGENTPLDDLDYSKLSGLRLTGAEIKNIAIAAASKAAADGTRVGMKHIKVAAQAEMEKARTTLPDSYFRGWT